jgi:hypothetical protein
LRCSSNSTEFRTANERRFLLSKRIYSRLKKEKTPSKPGVRIKLKGEGRADRASKPASFAEKKNAKSAAPPRVSIVLEANTGAARIDSPPADQRHDQSGYDLLFGHRGPILYQSDRKDLESAD